MDDILQATLDTAISRLVGHLSVGPPFSYSAAPRAGSDRRLMRRLRAFRGPPVAWQSSLQILIFTKDLVNFSNWRIIAWYCREKAYAFAVFSQFPVCFKSCIVLLLQIDSGLIVG